MPLEQLAAYDLSLELLALFPLRLPVHLLEPYYAADVELAFSLSFGRTYQLTVVLALATQHPHQLDVGQASSGGEGDLCVD